MIINFVHIDAHGIENDCSHIGDKPQNSRVTWNGRKYGQVSLSWRETTSRAGLFKSATTMAELRKSTTTTTTELRESTTTTTSHGRPRTPIDAVSRASRNRHRFLGSPCILTPVYLALPSHSDRSRYALSSCL